MKLNIFESRDGDCLLLEGKSGHRILCDGGRSTSMRSHVRQELAKLRTAKSKIDIVYVSHVDNDHITGVLQLLQDELEWRVHDHKVKTGLKKKKPTAPRPPEIGTVWHNAFRDQIDEDTKSDAIESLLAAAVPTLNGTGVKDLEQAAMELGELATAVQEGIKVSHLVSPALLNIPLNRLPGKTGKSKLLMLRPAQKSFPVGSLNVTLVGPGKKELDDLRDGWNNWLNDNDDTVKKVRAQMKKRIEDFSSGTLNGGLFDLSDWNGIPPYKKVTTPNIASLMLMVEEGGKRILLTGDAQQYYIIAGLEKTGFLSGTGGLHLDALKVQHHGSENNVDDKFCRRVSADHYVFCGNGAHNNPELSVIDIVFESRLGAQSKRALAPQANNRSFAFWFSTTSKAQKSGSKEQKAFAKVEARVKQLQKSSKGKLKIHFNKGAFTTLNV